MFRWASGAASNTNQNAIYMECFIDELAHAAGKDPLEFRRAMLTKSPKHLAVLNAAAEKAGWGTPLPTGVFRGICQNYGYGSYTAAVAEVSVSPKGELKVHRIVAATDPGYAVNPQQIEAQVAGLVRLWPERGAVRRDHHRRRAARWRATSTPIR